jgi:hypothetical protein
VRNDVHISVKDAKDESKLMKPEEMAAELVKAGYTVHTPRKKPKARRCSVCGAVDQDAAYNPEWYDTKGIDLEAEDLEVAEWLTEITVETNPNEEGFDQVTRLYCEQHDGDTIKALTDLGFKSHHHGGTALLEDRECAGYRNMDDCPFGRSSPYDEDER